MMIDSARYPASRASRHRMTCARSTNPEGAVADELRAYLIESVGKSGGHFAAGLGVIELTVALHYLYQTPVDQLVWDVGHQTYPHKILTGRRDEIHTVKQKDGVAPFPKREESEYDTFGVGHSSTSISAALGMAIARQSEGDDRKVVAVIGDGAMTAGMAFEALMHAGGMEPEPNLLVILNDNNMSISEAVGGLTKMLGRATGSRTLNALREGGKKILGDKKNNPARFVKRWEEHWKGMFVPSTMFEEMGFHYTGPIDGHDMPALLSTLKTLRASKGEAAACDDHQGQGLRAGGRRSDRLPRRGPIRSGQGPGGQAGAKSRPIPMYSATGCAMPPPPSRASTASLRPCAKALAWCASARVPAALFRRGDRRAARGHPRRRHGPRGKPVVAIYSTFLQRAYDQLVHDVAIQDLDVLFAIDRAGVVGPDGATHAGNLDLSFLRCVPNMVVMAPSNEAECRQMLSTGLQQVRLPCATRAVRVPALRPAPTCRPCRSARASCACRATASPCLPSAAPCPPPSRSAANWA